MNQITIIREALNLALVRTDINYEHPFVKQALKSLTELESAMREPAAWMYQHDETGRMTTVANDGINTPEVFTNQNPQWHLIGPCFALPRE